MYKEINYKLNTIFGNDPGKIIYKNPNSIYQKNPIIGKDLGNNTQKMIIISENQPKRLNHKNIVVQNQRTFLEEEGEAREGGAEEGEAGEDDKKEKQKEKQNKDNKKGNGNENSNENLLLQKFQLDKLNKFKINGNQKKENKNLNFSRSEM